MKPIIGCEMYVAYGSRLDKAGVEDQQADAGSNNHLIVLAANDAGYRNLVKLVSAGYTEGFYYKPRIDKELLREHREGLIVLSSCLKGEVSQSLAGGNYAKAKDAALQYRDILGAENFFLEIQDHGIPDQQKIIPMMARLGEETSACSSSPRTTRTTSNKDDAFAHEVLLCIGTGKTLNDERRMKFYSDDFYVKSPDEMARLFRAYPEAVANTVRIAERVKMSLDTTGLHLPNFPVPKGMDAAAYFEKIARSERTPGRDGAAVRREAQARAAGVPRPARDRDRDHQVDGVPRLLPRGVGLHQVREGQRHPGRAGPRIRRPDRSWRTRWASPTSIRSSTTCCSSASSIPSASRCPTSTSTSA